MAANPDTFRSRLRLAQDRRGLPAGDLARLAGASQRSVERWRTGPELPGLAAVYALADALGVDAGWLVGGAGDGP